MLWTNWADYRSRPGGNDLSDWRSRSSCGSRHRLLSTTIATTVATTRSRNGPSCRLGSGTCLCYHATNIGATCRSRRTESR